MKTLATLTLAEQRESLQLKLAAHRRLLVEELAPPPPSDYPRSMTMRFLNRGSFPAAKVFAGVATVLFGLRIARSLKATLGVIKLARSVVK